MVFSAPSAEAGRSISHHWGRDNRWDILPDRMTELPAGLRPRKQGVNWMRGMSAVSYTHLAARSRGQYIPFATNNGEFLPGKNIPSQDELSE